MNESMEIDGFLRLGVGFPISISISISYSCLLEAFGLWKGSMFPGLICHFSCEGLGRGTGRLGG